MLAAFKGAVDGYILINNLIESDSGLRYVCLQYNIEKHKLDIWGDYFKVDDVANCTLRGQSPKAKQLIANILAQIEAEHESAKPFVKRYDAGLEALPVGTGRVTTLHIGHSIVRGIKSARDKKSKKDNVRWVIQDKEKFSALVERLRKMNDDLYAVLDVETSRGLSATLSSYVLADIDDRESLTTLQNPENTISPLLALSAKLKRIQNDYTDGKNVTESVLHLPASTISVSKTSIGTMARVPGFYEPKDREGLEGKDLKTKVWIEWKYLSSKLTEPEKSVLLREVELLARLLTAADESMFRIPPFVGLFEDQQYPLASISERRIGLVYKSPSSSPAPGVAPCTLLEYIKATRKSTKGTTPSHATLPDLGERFKLAYDLSSAFSLLHASKWLHRGFSSHSILLFPHHQDTRKLDLENPYISGFGYSRQLADQSLEHRSSTGDPNIDIYIHPSAPMGFKQTFDVYSLGVVLFEIGLWAPLTDRLEKMLIKPLSNISHQQLSEALIGAVSSLGHVMGATYRDVVAACLTGGYADGFADNDNDFLAKAYFTDVVTPLGHLKA